MNERNWDDERGAGDAPVWMDEWIHWGSWKWRTWWLVFAGFDAGSALYAHGWPRLLSVASMLWMLVPWRTTA